MARIRAHLIDAEHPEAVALLRAARCVYGLVGQSLDCTQVVSLVDIIHGNTCA